MDFYNVVGPMQLLVHLADFREINDDAERVKYCENMLDEYNRLPVLPLSTPKSNVKALAFRQFGNTFFNVKQYMDALECYNKCIAYAEEDSENLGIGYANRSAVFFEWEVYEICLKNIKLAKESGTYPGNLRRKINKRETHCEVHLREIPVAKMEEPYQPKLSFPANPNIPFVADCLEFRENEEFGRHIICNRTVGVGKILAIEDGCCVNLIPDFRFRRCTNCLSENMLTFIPCKTCTGALFCNKKCYEEAINSFHKYECPIVDFLVEYPQFRNVVRAIIEAFLGVDSIEELITFTEEVDETQLNAFTIDRTNYNPKQNYKLVYTLATNQDKRPEEEIFNWARYSAILFHVLVNYTDFRDVVQDERTKTFLRKYIFRMLQISSTNFRFISIPSAVTCNGMAIPIKHGTCVNPVCSLINHSCEANTAILSHGTKSILYTIRPIKSGQQIFNDYIEAEENRKEVLMRKYFFTCPCPDSHDNYLSYSLKKANMPIVCSPDDMLELYKFDDKYVLRQTKLICKLLAKYDRYYPCWEIYHQRLALDLCLIRLMSVPTVIADES